MTGCVAAPSSPGFAFGGLPRFETLPNLPGRKTVAREPKTRLK